MHLSRTVQSTSRCSFQVHGLTTVSAICLGQSSSHDMPSTPALQLSSAVYGAIKQFRVLNASLTPHCCDTMYCAAQIGGVSRSRSLLLPGLLTSWLICILYL
jgi:hypothetical protein